MRPLIRRAPNGHRYAVPSTPRQPAPTAPRQSTNGHDNAPELTREPRAKLTEDDVREARAMYAAGRFGVKDLAYIFGVSPSNMSAVISRHTWKNVGDQP